MPSSVVTAWEFQDDLSGLNSASVYYVTKSEEGSYDWASWKQNNNYRYYDTNPLSIVESDELKLSDLPSIVATTNIATHDKAGNFISYGRDEGYFELIQVSKLSNTTALGGNIQSNIFVVTDANTQAEVVGNSFDDFVYFPGQFSEYEFVAFEEAILVTSDNISVTASNVEFFGFADRVANLASLNLYDVTEISDDNPVSNEVPENVLGASVGITASATDADTSDTVSYTLVMTLVVCSRLTLMAW